jgi:hypothetical protein
MMPALVAMALYLWPFVAWWPIPPREPRKPRTDG